MKGDHGVQAIQYRKGKMVSKSASILLLRPAVGRRRKAGRSA